MLTISPNQLEQIKQTRTDLFVKKLITHFKKLKPKLLPKSNEKIEQFIRKKIDESKLWELKTDGDIEKYIYLSLHYAVLNKLPRAKYIIAILTLPNYSGTQRIDALHIELVKKAMNKK